MGLWDEDKLENILEKATIDQYHGQDSAICFNYPGVGMFQPITAASGIETFLGFDASASDFAFQNDPVDAPWDTMGRWPRENSRNSSPTTANAPDIHPDGRPPHKRNGISVT